MTIQTFFYLLSSHRKEGEKYPGYGDEKVTFQEVGKSENPEDGEDTMYYLCPICQEEMWAEPGSKVLCEPCPMKLLEEDEVLADLPENFKKEIWETPERCRFIGEGADHCLS